MAALRDPACASAFAAPARASRAHYVAVSGGAEEYGADATAPRPAPDGRLRGEALRTAREGAPALLVVMALALAVDLVLLAPSADRWWWLGISVACVCAWAATLGFAPQRLRRASGLRLWKGAFLVLVVAALLALAVPPWLAGPAGPSERMVLALALLLVSLVGAKALAPLPVAAGVAAGLPVSAALAEAVRTPDTPALAIAGVSLLLVSVPSAWLHRRAWLRAAHRLLQRELRIRELAEERDAALRADHEKSRFLAIASHDLRQPMHALGLFAATLEKRLQATADAALVHNLVRSIDGLDRSFNVMLDISRLDAGTIEPNFQQFPLRDLFRRLHMHFAGQAEQAGLGLRFYPGGKSVTSDPQLLERILGNLLQNAIRYTAHGGIVVVARTTRDHINVEVWDTGPGIPAPELPRIFGEFYQVGRGERARDRGVGMGLAIVKRLAMLLGHRLEVASQPGRGTMFRIGIPVGGLPGMQDVTGAADTLPMPLPVQQPRIVLIVDDEEPIREGLKLLLDEWGYQALAAGSVAQALQAVHRLDAPPDVILSDLHLGEGPDGIAAIDAVRAACGFDVTAILITGDTSPEELRRATDSGHAVLFKPVQPRKLLNALRGYIP